MKLSFLVHDDKGEIPIEETNLRLIAYLTFIFNFS